MLRSGETFAGYLIERELGRGGMGSVYLARHPRLPRLVAIKLLSAELFGDSEVRARFEREGDVVARLDHPNIVPLFDRGFDDDRMWIAMRYIDGIDASMLESANLPPRQAVRIIGETGKALDFAHRKGVLHRDVKPANILIERVDGDERIFLADFGIARLRDENTKLTQTGSFTATLAYAAPEQLSGQPLDHRCDQYSLACTLFRLLTGTVPFDAQHPIAIMRGHLDQPPPPVSSLRPGLPPALDAVMAKAMAKHPTARFDSCTAFATAAQQALDGMPAQTSGARHPMAGQPAPGPTGGRFPRAVSNTPPTPFATQGMAGAAQGRGAMPPGMSGAAQGRGVVPPAQGKPYAAAGSSGQFPVHPNPAPGASYSATGRTGAASSATARPSAGVAPQGKRPVTKAATSRADSKTRGKKVFPPPPKKPKKKSRTRGCLLWLVGIILIPLLLVAVILVAIDQARSTGTSNSPAVTPPPAPAHTTTEEYYDTTTEPEPEPSGGTASATPEYTTTAAPAPVFPFGLH
ncbi:protein kinase [Nocardia sp. NBC_01503]|uniref:serine/threonine-protein kinase n=1 Tax=Nocardia sp. NBC_01503 TaxID=2975997 RepID=UPI002E7BCBDB|nr:protein kinase [Nocardia sp. NBC_01503]WTL35906.1 protein kinase [Nocardia sp. NBC_01503]